MYKTVGGGLGHWTRRALHVAMMLIPILYYYWGNYYLVWFVLALVILIEIIRLRRGFVIFGQRQHEARQISSFAWGVIGIAVVLLLVPKTIYAIPIVAACAIGDPLLGELRLHRVPAWLTALLGVFVVAVIWWVSNLWLHMNAWMPWLLAIVTVAAEWPNIKWIDDNALMQWAPLLLILLMYS